MSTIPAQATSVRPERLTWNEICRRFPDAWAVLADADWANETDFDFASAEVLGHHARRRDALAGREGGARRQARGGLLLDGRGARTERAASP